MKLRILIFVFGFIGLFSCKLTKDTSVSKLDQLKTMMSGYFTSEHQARADSSYYDITLQMVPIWWDREGDWLYVEQSVSSNLNSPYRQRIYKLEQLGENSFVSKVFAFNEPDLFVGMQLNPMDFEKYDESIMYERTGCGVYLEYVDGAFIGSTKDDNCLSSLRGASYASSKVKIDKNLVTSWDQGFDANGKQVWGAVDGPYEFRKYIVED